MTAGCIDRTGSGCGGCEKRGACAPLFAALGLTGSWPSPAKRRSNRSPKPSIGPLLTFLGHVAKAIEAGAKPRKPKLAREVEQRVEPLLDTGTVRIEQVARELGYSRQTLYRRLKAEGLTFEQLVDGLRRRLALRLIGEGQSVKSVAYRLGFSDPSAFSRAFKRWTGSSPRARRGG